ncbi:chemotaxis protein [Fusobacterium sp.]|uniref:chemotaxis protein n=1 Tax=Fusobacterium sp. TaxID=68766 RepID=UPI00396CAF1A
MELYIDNKKVKLKRKNYKTFGKAINDIIVHLKKDNKIPYKFYINGESLKDNTIINVDKLELIEVITKSEGEVLLDSLLKAKQQIEMFFELFDDENLDSDEPLIINEIELLERGIFLRWFYNLLLLIKTSGDLEFVYDDFNEYIKDFEEELKLAENAYDSKDYETFVEILHFSISDLLEEFYDNIENYFNNIATEENRKRLPN